MVVVVVVVLLVPTLVLALGVVSGVAVVAFVLPVLLLDTATGIVNDDMTVVVGTTASGFARWTAFVRFELVVFLLLLLLLLL